MLGGLRVGDLIANQGTVDHAQITGRRNRKAAGILPPEKCQGTAGWGSSDAGQVASACTMNSSEHCKHGGCSHVTIAHYVSVRMR